MNDTSKFRRFGAMLVADPDCVLGFWPFTHTHNHTRARRARTDWSVRLESGDKGRPPGAGGEQCSERPGGEIKSSRAARGGEARQGGGWVERKNNKSKKIKNDYEYGRD